MRPTTTDDIIFYRVIICLLASLICTGTVFFFLEPTKKELWFKRREKYTPFNKRGPFGEFINIGYPCTWQGVTLTAILCGFLITASYIFVFVM